MNRSLLATSFALACTLFVSSARADQCEVLSTDHATWAQKLLKSGAVIAKFCESCGDTTPGAPTTISKVAATAVKGDKDKRTIAINGKSVDLAYTYLQTGKTTWTNVGLLVGCPVTGGTPIFTAAASTTASNNQPIGIQACDEYLTAVDKLTQCKSFPKDSTDAMKQATEALRKSLKDAPPEAKRAAAEGCKTAVTAIRDAAKSMNCPL